MSANFAGWDPADFDKRVVAAVRMISRLRKDLGGYSGAGVLYRTYGQYPHPFVQLCAHLRQELDACLDYAAAMGAEIGFTEAEALMDCGGER